MRIGMFQAPNLGFDNFCDGRMIYVTNHVKEFAHILLKNRQDIYGKKHTNNEELYLYDISQKHLLTFQGVILGPSLLDLEISISLRGKMR